MIDDITEGERSAELKRWWNAGVVRWIEGRIKRWRNYKKER